MQECKPTSGDLDRRWICLAQKQFVLVDSSNTSWLHSPASNDCREARMSYLLPTLKPKKYHLRQDLSRSQALHGAYAFGAEGANTQESVVIGVG